MSERTNEPATTFGDLLRRLRKRAGMTQEELAAATGYSRSLIAAQERNLRLPGVEAVIRSYLPALGLQDEPLLAAQLVALAAAARGERPPASLTFTRERRIAVTEEGEAHCWPAPPTEILGRAGEIRRLCDRFLGHHGRLLTLIGPPGVGKTRLALAAGAGLAGFFRDGACFVPLAAVSDPELAASTLASALGLSEGSARPPQARLIEHLRRREMLLVLDNFEQLISAASPAVALVAALLAGCPGLHLLITSRERLHLRAEQRYPVRPLALDAAVALFVQRGTAVNGAFALTEANRPIVEAICERLDCLPLAIELGAAQLDLLSPSRLLDGLGERRLDLLADGAQDLPPHQRTLRTALAHSYALLDGAQRLLFRSLGVFAGGCRTEELQAICPGDEEATGSTLFSVLHALIGKSLVRAEETPDGATRYLLLETTRAYALEQARAAGEEAGLRERHCAAYLRLFREGDGRLRGPESSAWLERLEPEQDNLRAALRWTSEEGRQADMAWLLLASYGYQFQVGRWHELRRWIAQLLPHRAELAPNVRMALLLYLWSIARATEEPRPMDPYTVEMRSLLDRCPEQLLHSGFWHFTACDCGDLPAAAAAWERAIACARASREGPELGPEFGVASDHDFILGNDLWALAQRLVDHGEFARAAPLLVESAQIFEARGSRWEMADSFGVSGLVALLLGDLPKAHALLHQAVALAGAYNYQEMMGAWQPLLGLVTLYGGDAAEARRLLDASLRLCLELGDKYQLARVCAYQAETALWEGQPVEAAAWLARSFGYDADPDRAGIYQVERILTAARIAAALGRMPRAAALFGLAERLRSPLNFEFAGPMRRLAEDAMAATRAALGDLAFAEGFAAGRQLSLGDAAFAEGFAALAGSGGAPAARLLSHA